MVLALRFSMAQGVALPPAASAPPNASAKPGSVDGVVTNSLTGDPVKNASVTLTGSPRTSYQAITDTAGHFHVANITPDTYIVNADRDGFIGQRGNWSQPIRVGQEQNVKDVAIQLLPLAHVSGRVLDVDGDPIMLANVQALRYQFNRGRKQLIQAGFANTNDLGEFQFLNLEPGRYYFAAIAQQRIPNLPPRTRFSGQQTTFPFMYYPSSLAPGQATATDLAPGAEVTGIDFRLAKMPAFHVRGKVVDETGQPPRFTNVQLQADESGGPPRQVASAAVPQDGTFDLRGIVPGTYVLIASRGGQVADAPAAYARETVTISDEDLNGLNLVLTPRFEVRGRFSVDGPAGARMNGSLGLQPVDAPSTNLYANASEDGGFVIQSVSAGSYFIDVNVALLGLHVKSIRFGDADISSGLLTVTPGLANATLNIILGSDGGQIQGTVQKSGEPSTAGIVTLAPAADLPGRLDLIKQVGTDSNGNFQFQSVAPGDYKVFAWEELDPGLIDNFAFRAAMASHAASVTVAPNGSETVQIELISRQDMEKEKNKL